MVSSREAPGRDALAALGQLIGKADEGRQVQLFGAQTAIYARCLDGFGIQQALEGVAQGLAPLIERSRTTRSSWR